MDVTPDKLLMVFQGMIILIASIALHEFGHAYMADRLGDPTPRSQGRVTLNPVPHIDPIGTLLLPFIGAFAGATFGWGKPVSIRPERLTRRFSMETGHALVAIAGPAMNVILGTVLTAVTAGLLVAGVLDPYSRVSETLFLAARLNFVLFFFNLIPISPLDGGAVAMRFIPYKHKRTYEQIAVYAPFVLMAIVMISPLRVIFTVPADFVHRGVFTGFQAVAQLFV
jgi:Zn-dependent protease